MGSREWAIGRWSQRNCYSAQDIPSAGMGLYNSTDETPNTGNAFIHLSCLESQDYYQGMYSGGLSRAPGYDRCEIKTLSI